MKALKHVILGFIVLFPLCLFSQQPARPKLVVGIVVDQMRWDYLYRFSDRYGQGGFRRLQREGFTCDNTWIPYLPTVTAPGHACIYTGSVPALHGIMGNNWYEPSQRRTVYCVGDTAVQSVGTTSAEGHMSPRNLWSSTITDELKLASNFRSRIISIALKDRGAVLPAGHGADGAFWFDNASGSWISSTWYMSELPAWMQRINAKQLPHRYMQQDWNTLYPSHTYRQSMADSSAFEGRMTDGVTFPHRLSHARADQRYEHFRSTPFAATYTFETAMEAIRSEQMGKDSTCDFLALSISSTDYAGHKFGPNSVEVEDSYLRLDRDVARFLEFLDKSVGRGQYLVFLSSDHGAANNAPLLKQYRMTGDILDMGRLRVRLNDSLSRYFGSRHLVATVINHQVYLDHRAAVENNIDRAAVLQYIRKFLLAQPGIAFVTEPGKDDLSLPEHLRMVLGNSYNQKRSGDLQYHLMPQWFESRTTGTTHSTWNPYDARIPLIWFGWKIPAGKTSRQVYMTDIAPTLAALLHIPTPNAAIGQVITEVVR
ncbi:MAG TPA: alkaline phosphatase PafA [Flavisolibacter sp.]